MHGNWIQLSWLSFVPFSTKGKSDAIGIIQFIDFLNDKQRDPRLNEILYPLYNEKRATEIIEEYEQDKDNRLRSNLLKLGFIAEIVSNLDAFKKQQGAWAKTDSFAILCLTTMPQYGSIVLTSTWKWINHCRIITLILPTILISVDDNLVANLR